MSVNLPAKIVAALLVTSGLLSQPLVAQTATATATENQEITKLRSEFLSDFREEVIPASQQYVVELRRLEKKFAQGGDYRAAIEARDERLAVEEFLGSGADPGQGSDDPDPPEPAKPRGIKLMIAAAMVSGGAALEGAELRMASETAIARWLLGDLEPGGYEIEVTYSAAGDSTVRAKESFFRLTTELPSTAAGKRVSRSLGTLKITERSDSISLLRTDAAGDTGLTIFAVKLISAKD